MKSMPLNAVTFHASSLLPGDELPAVVQRADRWLTPATLVMVALALLSVLIV